MTLSSVLFLSGLFLDLHIHLALMLDQGALLMRLRVGVTSFCFVNVHLSPGIPTFIVVMFL